MQIIAADETRMIDLPGVGPCPRPVDIDQSVTGFATLKSLRIYRFAPAVTIEGESEKDEVYVVPVGGAVRMQIGGAHPLEATLSETGHRALYMTPHHAYRLTPESQVQVAYARAAATGTVACHVIEGRRGDRAEALAFDAADLAEGATLIHDARRERLIHVISGALDVGGVSVASTGTIALAAGEAAMVRASGATAVLMFSA